MRPSAPLAVAALATLAATLPLAPSACAPSYRPLAEEADSAARDASPTIDAPPPMDALVADAGGDPSLDRAPQTTCFDKLTAATVGAKFPGYVLHDYRGALPGGGPLTNLTEDVYACANGIVQVRLRYDPPAAERINGPSQGLRRDGLSAVEASYVVEQIAAPGEADGILAGAYVQSGNTLETVRILDVLLLPDGTFAVGRVTLAATELVPFGPFQPPFRVRVSARYEAGGDGGVPLAWAVTLTDRAHSVTRTGVESTTGMPLTFLLGTGRYAPSAETVATFSGLSLP